MSPSWGATAPGVLLVEGASAVPPAPAPGAICFAACAPFAALLLPAAPVKARALPTNPQLLKKLAKLYAPSAWLPSAFHMPFHAVCRILHHHMAGGQFVPDGVGGGPVLGLAGFRPLLDERLDLRGLLGKLLPGGLWAACSAASSRPRDSTWSKSWMSARLLASERSAFSTSYSTVSPKGGVQVVAQGGGKPLPIGLHGRLIPAGPPWTGGNAAPASGRPGRRYPGCRRGRSKGLQVVGLQAEQPVHQGLALFLQQGHGEKPPWTCSSCPGRRLSAAHGDHLPQGAQMKLTLGDLIGVVGRALSMPPQWIFKYSPAPSRRWRLHSMCQPG